ncbi:MAG: 50S ribosomal protein L18 [bacterium]
MIHKSAMQQERARQRRRKHIHKVVRGTAQRPRLVVYRSNRHIYAQLIDDDTGRTLSGISSLMPHVKQEIQGKKPLEVARRVGQAVAQRAKEKQIETVVFDRNGFLYHGRVRALAEGAREGGLKF